VNKEEAMKSQGVVWPAVGQIEIEDIEVADPGPGELLLEAECTLISPGTERAFLLNLPNTSGEYPSRPGYNFLGRVAATGRGVEGVEEGRRVVAAARHAGHVKVKGEGIIPVPEGLASEAAVVIEASGHPEPIDTALHIARPARESRPGVWTWAEDCRTVLALLRRGRLRVEPLITHRFPVGEAATAYKLLKEWDPGFLGVILQWK